MFRQIPTSRQTSRVTSRVTSRQGPTPAFPEEGGSSEVLAYPCKRLLLLPPPPGGLGRDTDGRLTGGVSAIPPASKPFAARRLRARREVGRLDLQSTKKVLTLNRVNYS